MNGWKVAAVFAVVLIVGSVYETWAVWMEERHPNLHLSITGITKRRTHMMILVYLFVFSMFGYALGVGEVLGK